MSIARPAPLTLLAIALTLMAVAAALFILYAHPAYAEEGSAPDKPIGLTGTATHDAITLTWNDPNDDSITGYVVLRRNRDTDAKGHFDELVADTGTAATTYTDDSVAAETRYTYRIKATNEHGTSERSRWYHIDTQAPPEPAANSPATGAPTITGTVQMGETLTANTSGIADADGISNVQYEYQWLADDAEIAGATNSTYTLADNDEGIAIKVEVTFTDDAGNGETLTSAATDAVAAAEPTEPPDKPTGLEATVSPGQVVLAWNDPDDESITGYVILRRVRVNDQGGDFSVLVANTESAATTYTDNEVAASTTYTYRIKATNEHGVSERSRWYHIDTPAAPEPAANSPATGAPTITGTVQMGETLTANTSGIADADGISNVQYEYQWLADDAEIAGATNSTYTLADNDEGIAIKVEVTFTDDAGNGETLTSAATDAVAAAEPTEPPDKPTGLEATVSPGQVVLAWNDPDDESITGYVILRRVRVNDQGGDFSVLVANTESAATTYTDNEVAASTTYTYRIKATNEHGVSERSRWYHIDTPAAPEPPANNPATGAPAITGTAQVGETLTVDTSGIADEDGLENAAFSYQWLADGTAISGATANAYTPVGADEGNAITVQVNFTDDAGNDETLTSAPTDAVAAAEPKEPPAQPTGLIATATHDQVLLTWEDPQDDSITGYVILRRVRVNDTGGEFSVLAPDTGTAATTYTDDTVEASTTYTYRIRAINQHGASERSRWHHIATPAAPQPEADPELLAPSGLTAVLTDGQVALSWDAPAEDAAAVTGYEVLRAESEGELAVLVADTGNTATAYSDFSAGGVSESYAYRVRAIRGEEKSADSNEARVQLPPARPTGVVSASSSDLVLLSWADPGDDSITGYRILRRGIADEADDFLTLAEDTGTAETSYADDTVERETSYVYRVLAINPGGVSEPSQDVRVRTTEPIPPPNRLRGLPSQTTQQVRQNVSEPSGDDFAADDSTQGRLEVGGSVTGNIDRNGDLDAFAIELVRGRTYRFDLEGSETEQGTLADPQISFIFRRVVSTGSSSVVPNANDTDSGDGEELPADVHATVGQPHRHLLHCGCGGWWQRHRHLPAEHGTGGRQQLRRGLSCGRELAAGPHAERHVGRANQLRVLLVLLRPGRPGGRALHRGLRHRHHTFHPRHRAEGQRRRRHDHTGATRSVG